MTPLLDVDDGEVLDNERVVTNAIIDNEVNHTLVGNRVGLRREARRCAETTCVVMTEAGPRRAFHLEEVLVCVRHVVIVT